MELLNIADYNPNTEAEGPGRRFAIWVQGCPIQCPGCCNPQFLAPVPRFITKADEFFHLIAVAKQRHGIEGVTFLGGEPMVQARGLAALARLSRQHGLTVMVFSGYTLAQIHEMKLAGTRQLLAETDVLVD